MHASAIESQLSSQPSKPVSFRRHGSTPTSALPSSCDYIPVASSLLVHTLTCMKAQQHSIVVGLNHTDITPRLSSNDVKKYECPHYPRASSRLIGVGEVVSTWGYCTTSELQLGEGKLVAHRVDLGEPRAG